uniref:ADAM metallopeptidase domain 28 n=1 Tax=Neogobius melanostomus TaxID=47308 RepID=A0A8C6T063_9GOBI
MSCWSWASATVGQPFLFLLRSSLHSRLCLSSAVSHGPVLNVGEDYEVVRPIRLHTIDKRHADAERVKYALTFILSYLCDSQDNCYYQGQIAGDRASAASISTCDGLRGYFRTSARRYLIEPLTSEPEGDHAVVPVHEEDSSESTPAVCGVANTTWNDDYEPPTGRSRSRSAVSAGETLYSVLFQFIKMKKDMTELRKRMFEVVNFVNMAYKPLRTFVALVGLEVWSGGDQISITPPAGANLDAFMKWRNTELVKLKNHDNAHLISGIDFEGATVGLAFVGTLCSGHSVGVVQDHNDRAIAVAATLAHEMGHNLGMDHDDSSACVCTGDSCIMAASLSWNVPRSFSSCSGNNYEKYLMGRTPSCLLDTPHYRSLVAPAVCGNGFVEAGELCDCGTVEECTNRCCNASTCLLSEGSQCAEGECCEDCKIQPRSHECRWKQDECDLAEYCDGTNAVCPENVFAVNGEPCDRGLGYCYNGQCPQRPQQCQKMYGPAAMEARSGCFDQNTRGTYYAFCKRTSDKYIPCQKEDVFCGKLFCQNGNASPNYGRIVQVGDCKATFYSDFTKDYGQVDTGTKCGDGKVCSQNECVELETAYRNVNCSAKCPGHAVCNHRSECQCEPGWMPPNCDTEDGEFSMSTGDQTPSTFCEVVIILIVVACAQAANPRPRGAPPPPPPAGNRPKPQQNYTAVRQVRPTIDAFPTSQDEFISIN